LSSNKLDGLTDQKNVFSFFVLAVFESEVYTYLLLPPESDSGEIRDSVT
jgi:hypothetical protein